MDIAWVRRFRFWPARVASYDTHLVAAADFGFYRSEELAPANHCRQWSEPVRGSASCAFAFVVSGIQNLTLPQARNSHPYFYKSILNFDHRLLQHESSLTSVYFTVIELR
jgi:hypothetical protein